MYYRGAAAAIIVYDITQEVLAGQLLIVLLLILRLVFCVRVCMHACLFVCVNYPSVLVG